MRKKFIVWFHRKSQSNERNFGLKSLEFHDGALIESLLVLVFALFVFVSQIVIPNYSTFKYSSTQNTVELGYNDHGYNEFTVIANKLYPLIWSSIFYQWNFMLIANNFN